MPTPEQARKHGQRLLEAARAVVAEPNDMERRTDYLRAVFNLDWTAAAIVCLADHAEVDAP